LQDGDQGRFVDTAAVGDPENVIVVQHAGLIQIPPHERHPRPQQERAGRKRLARQPHRAQAEIAADTQDHLQNQGVQVEVLVSVRMIKREPCGSEPLELGANLRRQLRPRGRQHHEAHGACEHPVVEPAVAADEIGN
jgi:hypothetical protein